MCTNSLKARSEWIRLNGGTMLRWPVLLLGVLSCPRGFLVRRLAVCKGVGGNRTRGGLVRLVVPDVPVYRLHCDHFNQLVRFTIPSRGIVTCFGDQPCEYFCATPQTFLRTTYIFARQHVNYGIFYPNGQPWPYNHLPRKTISNQRTYKSLSRS
jgi:hypothetical protein